MAVTADRVVVELEARLDRYEANVRRAGQSFDRTTAQIQRQATATERRVQGMATGISASIRQAVSAIAVTAALGAVTRYADNWTRARNVLAAAGVEAAKLDSTLNRLADTANGTRSSFGATVDLYAKLLRSTQDLTVSEAQVLRMTELINKAFIAGGASSAEAASGVLQLGQALASGILQGDELRSIRENAPLLARAIADEMNTTVGALKKLGEEGKITADVIANAIINAGSSIDTQFATTVPTIESALQRISTEYGRFQASLDKSVGASQGVAAFISYVADNMDLFAQATLIAAAAVGGRFVGALLASANAQDGMIGRARQSVAALTAQAAAELKAAQAANAAAIANVQAAQSQVARAQGTVALNSALTVQADAQARAAVTAAALQAAQLRMTVTSRAAAIAARGLSAALAFFGGPIGLAITAIAVAIGYIAGEAAKSQAAADGLATTIETMASQAERAGVSVKNLTDDSNNSATASNAAAGEADQQAAAYERVRVAAINAGRAIQFMSAAERQSKLDELDEGLKGLSSQIRGGGITDPFRTDQVERERNSRRDYERTFGRSRGVFADMAGSFDLDAEGRAAAERGLRDVTGLTNEQKRLRQVYLNNQAVTRDLLNQEREARALREQLFSNINAPTLDEPEQERVTFQPGRTPPSSGSGSRRKGKSAEELASRREELAVSAQIEALRLRGSEAEAEALGDRLDITQRIRAYEDAGLSAAQARAEAEEDVAAITEARAVAYERERAAIRESAALEAARLSGDVETVRNLERAATLRGLEQDYARSGLTLEQARLRAAEDLATVEAGRRAANARELAAMARGLELELASTREQFSRVRALENAAFLEERIQSYRERDLGVVVATGLATSDLLRLEEARVDAASRVLAEQQASYELRLAEARLDERAATRLRREERIRGRSRELQGARVPEDQANARARYEVLSEEVAGIQGQFRDVVRGGFRAALEGDVLPFLQERLNDIGAKMFDAAADQLADVLFNAARDLLPSLFPDPGEAVDVAVESAAQATRDAATALAITTAHTTGGAAVGAAIVTSSITAGATMGAAITAAGAQAAAAMAAAVASGGGGGGGGDVGTIASLFAGGGKAGGGRVYRGSVYPVGENGPELFAPDAAGIIIPNGRMNGGGGGGNGAVNVRVENHLGVEAKTSYSRDADGTVRVNMEPMLDRMLEGAGKSGKLERARRKTPQPNPRG